MRFYVKYLLCCVGTLLLLVVLTEAGGRLYIHLKYGVPGKSYGIY